MQEWAAPVYCTDQHITMHVDNHSLRTTPILDNSREIDLLQVVGNEWTNLKNRMAKVSIWTGQHMGLCHARMQGTQDLRDSSMIELLAENAELLDWRGIVEVEGKEWMGAA